MGRPRKIDVTKDWQPPNPLRLNKKENSKSYRWIRRSEMDLRKQQGWEPVGRSAVGLENDPRISRGDGAYAQCNELVLCQRPQEMNDAHKAYLEEKNKKVLAALGNQFHQEGQRSGFSTYGNVKVESK